MLFSRLKYTITPALKSFCRPLKTIREQSPLRIGAYVIPRLGKSECEDAHFISESMFGIADGVGSWAHIGVNSGFYARALMAHCQRIVLSQVVPPNLVISSAAKAVRVARPVIRGSATALVASVTRMQQHPSYWSLQVASIGDCGLRVIRQNKMVFSTSPQMRGARPLQLGEGGDPSSAVAVSQLQIEDADWIVAGSDGLFDNSFDSDIISLLQRHGSRDPQFVATQIAHGAFAASLSRSLPTPFSAANPSFIDDDVDGGGKPDDITVIVARLGYN